MGEHREGEGEVAAMLRLGDREFTSLGEDKAIDLLVERDVRQHIDGSRSDIRPVCEAVD